MAVGHLNSTLINISPENLHARGRPDDALLGVLAQPFPVLRMADERPIFRREGATEPRRNVVRYESRFQQDGAAARPRERAQDML